MFSRLIDLLKFSLERTLLRGTHVRLLVMAALIGLVSLAGGLIVQTTDPAFDHPGKAIWWAFLRLSDPGYLGDDEGLARRIVSTILTVLGYVLFMGSLVAVMTQWLNHTIRELESGLTRIVKRDHVVVLGWTSRTATIAREMFAGEGRVQRFLALHRAKRIHVVLLVEELSAALRYELREQMGKLWRDKQIVMRSGSALHVEHLHRVDYLHAAAILLPADDVGAEEGTSDARTIKTLRSIDTHSASMSEAELPLVVTEIFDASKLPITKRAYRGPLEVVASDRLIGRQLALTVLQPGLSRVFEELLALGTSSELRIWEPDRLVGERFDELARYFPRAVVVGVVKKPRADRTASLCPRPDDTLQAGDHLVLLAAKHEDATPDTKPMAVVEAATADAVAAPPPALPNKLLIIGWSDRVPDLIAELAAHHGEALQVDVLSSVAATLRSAQLDGHELGATTVQQFVGDVTRSHVIAEQLAANYDRIALVASDWLASGAQSDARTIMVHLLVRDALSALGRNTPMTIELADAANRGLVEAEGVDIIVSPLIIGRVLAHVTLRRELGVVYDELLDATGPVIALRSARNYGLGAGARPFRLLEAVVAARGDVLLGILSHAGGERLNLNPAKDAPCELTARHALIVVTSTDRPASASS